MNKRGLLANGIKAADSPSQLTSARTKEPSDWRGEMFARFRILIRQADPEVVEEVKWRKPSNRAGVPVWSHAGISCTGETYKNAVKMIVAQGASLACPRSGKAMREEFRPRKRGLGRNACGSAEGIRAWLPRVAIRLAPLT